MVRRWRSWFLEGRQNVHDDERSSSPVTATDNASVAAVRNVVEADRRVTIDEIMIRMPPGIEIRRSSIGTIMSDVLNFRKVFARWVPRLLLENTSNNGWRQPELSWKCIKEMEINFFPVLSLEMKAGCIFQLQKQNDKSWCGRSLRKVHQKRRRSQSLQEKLWLCKTSNGKFSHIHLILRNLPQATSIFIQHSSGTLEASTLPMMKCRRRRTTGYEDRTRLGTTVVSKNRYNGKRHFLPGLMKDQPYDTIIQRIKLHLDPKKKVIPQRCRFLKRIQREGESISEYLRELKHLAINCNFVDMLGTMMRDRFVAGIKSEILQKKLLQEDNDVTLDKVFAVAIAFELAEINTRELQDKLVAKISPGETDATINLTVDEYSLCFTIDTGTPVTLIPKDIYKNYWQGVILSHRNDRKEEFPIAFVSRTLTEAEKRFSQLEKKALSITFGVEKFRQYLLGRKFVLVTDNRPLIHIFSPHKPIPICASSRIKIWSLKLAAFNYTVEFRKTSDNSNVDALSRLESSVRESLNEDQVLLLRKSNEVPFSFMEVANETPQDKILSIVLRNVREGNCIDSNIEELTRECRVCQESASMPPATISEWTWPEKPWHRLHLDLADNGRQFVSGEFEQFTKMNGIRHTKTSPYNPSTNGLAERYVRGFKNLLRNNNGKDDLETNLQRFLFAHRAFPQTVIKEFPGGTANEEKFKIKILEFNSKMGNPREVFHEAVRRQEQFTTGCEVYFRNYATGPKREEEVPEVTSGNKEETASVYVPSCTPIPGPVAVHVPSCTPKPEAAAVQVPVRSPRPQRARKPLDRLDEPFRHLDPAIFATRRFTSLFPDVKNCKPDNQLNHITPLPKDIKQENCESTNHSNSTINKIVKIPLDPVWISWNKIRPRLTRAISPKPWSLGGRFSVCQNGRVEVVDEGLIIHSARRQDTANYTCRAVVVTPQSSQLKEVTIDVQVQCKTSLYLYTTLTLMGLHQETAKF
ncbi:K02A2.6-like [Cordylochernes scorpioides]|uniref:K02A2.6-like n=1 Tax=Cordylochernes scorpioides TaxID=51811 RepID=A0ABY6LRU2_9ARAC|nr:K02A2.6-like [Cordylochernes scorpioides]